MPGIELHTSLMDRLSHKSLALFVDFGAMA